MNIYVKPGEIVCVIGPNGAGKSTVLKALYGFLNIRQGRVLFNDKDISWLGGYIFDTFGQYTIAFWLAFCATIAATLTIYRVEKKSIDDWGSRIPQGLPKLAGSPTPIVNRQSKIVNR